MPVDRKSFSVCPIERTLAVLSGRWKATVVWNLFSDSKRYSALLRLAPGVPERVLTQTLRELESDGVVRRKEGQWCLTEPGLHLIMAMNGLLEWGLHHAIARPERRERRCYSVDLIPVSGHTLPWMVIRNKLLRQGAG